MSKIDHVDNYNNVIFDLGGVFLNLDYAQTVNEFKKHLPQLNVETFFGKEHQLSFFSDYEIGLTKTEVFRAEFLQHYQSHISEAIFSKCWNAMIFDIPLKRIELIKKLRVSGKKVYLLSNINELHEEAVEKSFSELNLSMSFKSLFDKTYYSHHIGLRKPSAEIFERVLLENKLAKEETVFIDDSLHHITSAQKIGIKAIHLEGAKRIEDLDFFDRYFA